MFGDYRQGQAEMAKLPNTAFVMILLLSVGAYRATNVRRLRISTVIFVFTRNKNLEDRVQGLKRMKIFLT